MRNPISIPNSLTTVRRTFALPAAIVREALTLAPPHSKKNLNYLIKTALYEYVRAIRKKRFEMVMAEMARDMALTKESRAISKEFEQTEEDGLAS